MKVKDLLEIIENIKAFGVKKNWTFINADYYYFLFFKRLKIQFLNESGELISYTLNPDTGLILYAENGNFQMETEEIL